jgi:hypothetical protein
MAKRLGPASPKTVASQDGAERAAAGYLNECGRPHNPNSFKLMLESWCVFKRHGSRLPDACYLRSPAPFLEWASSRIQVPTGPCAPTITTGVKSTSAVRLVP